MDIWFIGKMDNAELEFIYWKRRNRLSQMLLLVFSHLKQIYHLIEYD